MSVAKMGSLARGVLVRQAFSKCGRRQHKKLLEKYGYGCLSSCARLEQLNTQAPFDEKTVTDMMHNRDPQPRLRLTEETARSLAKNFTSEDRQLLLKEIQQIKGDEAIREFSATSIPKPTPGQLIHTALFNSIPFIGFGFLDNVIMITAGDYIEASVGVAFGISTMAAAALGNAVSDVAGIGSAFYVEVLAMRIGVPAPSMTPEQHDLKISHWFSNIGRAFGVALGCILGMFPLFFLPGHNRTDEEEEGDAATSDGVAVLPAVKAEAPDATTATASKTAPTSAAAAEQATVKAAAATGTDGPTSVNAIESTNRTAHVASASRSTERPAPPAAATAAPSSGAGCQQPPGGDAPK
ncbi:transmembrane protein 65-like isoform X2 [Amphibalanus amphitrite]|uniref:transmembrane protein 65-like isoform X2 n=1 Tax=Amphibalanus amphitrite TaxID=1232801 RepID=UPI001C906884|nr:transmembrane protein 65-like isoform X2 [Amphibalanus amphitrite]